jgi:hypothetical protein
MALVTVHRIITRTFQYTVIQDFDLLRPSRNTSNFFLNSLPFLVLGFSLSPYLILKNMTKNEIRLPASKMIKEIFEKNFPTVCFSEKLIPKRLIPLAKEMAGYCYMIKE